MSPAASELREHGLLQLSGTKRPLQKFMWPSVIEMSGTKRLAPHATGGPVSKELIGEWLSLKPETRSSRKQAVERGEHFTPNSFSIAAIQSTTHLAARMTQTPSHNSVDPNPGASASFSVQVL